jgi:hypothetical protein
MYIQTGNSDLLRIDKDYLKEDVTKRIEVEDVDQYFSAKSQKSALVVIRKFYPTKKISIEVLKETMTQVVVIQANVGSDNECSKSILNLFGKELILPFSVILDFFFEKNGVG